MSGRKSGRKGLLVVLLSAGLLALCASDVFACNPPVASFGSCGGFGAAYASPVIVNQGFGFAASPIVFRGNQDVVFLDRRRPDIVIRDRGRPRVQREVVRQTTVIR